MDNKQNVIFNLLDESNFFRVSKSLIKYIKCFTTTGVLSELISLMRHYQKTNQLYEGKWFFYTRDKIEKDFFLSHYQQRSIFEKLESLELISSMEIPNTQVRRKYYTVNFDKLFEVLSQNCEQTYEEQKSLH